MLAKQLAKQLEIKKNNRKVNFSTLFCISGAQIAEGEGGGWGVGGLGRRRRFPLPFFENRRKVTWFYKKVYGLNPHLKCNFKSISEKKHQNFSLWGTFVCCTWNVYQSAPIPRNLCCPKKLLVEHLYIDCKLIGKYVRR